MDKLIYIRGCETVASGEPEKIELNVHADLSTHEFRIACIRLAQALGYGHQNIINEFGEITDGPTEKKILHG